MGDASTDEGRTAVETIARRHDVPVDAAAALLTAIRRGGGRQAQFRHPALGGMGQWSSGGGIMIGDMFNHALAAKVEQLCVELADLARRDRLFAGEPGASDGDWWPRDLGRPSAVGSQNEHGYAYFPEARRLAIRGPDGVSLYDTGDHRISGVSQQQSGTRELSFTSQHGSIHLSDLSPLGEEPFRIEADLGGSAEVAGATQPRRGQVSSGNGDDDILGLLARLHELQRKGILTQEEFAAKKQELLARL